MNKHMLKFLAGALVVLGGDFLAGGADTPQWRDLFNGRDLSGWVNVHRVTKLSVNGKFVNGISGASVKKGYLCLESEGAEIHFRNIRILELPPGITREDQAAPVVTSPGK